MSIVMCDKKIVRARLKGKLAREVMSYGLQTEELRKRQEAELEVAEVKMLSLSFRE